MEDTRTIATATIQLKHMLVLGAQFTEMATVSVGLKSQGFAQNILSQEEEITLCLRELALERVDSFKQLQRPELRLAMLFSTTLLATDQANRLKHPQADTPGSLPPPAATASSSTPPDSDIRQPQPLVPPAAYQDL